MKYLQKLISFNSALTNQMHLESGSISIDKSVTIALQEPWLMSGTVRENILFMCDFDPEWYNQGQVYFCEL